MSIDPAALAAVRAIIERHLGEDIDVNEPLVAQNVDSLSALEIGAAVAEQVGVDLPAEAMIAGASLAELMAAATPADAPVCTPVGDRHPLSVNQQALWFLDQRHGSSAAQHIFAAVRVRGGVDADALRRSLQAIVDRHPVLRTAIRADGDGEPYQVVLPALDVAFRVEDATGLDLADRLDREARGDGFSLADGRVLRAVLLRGDDDVLAIVVHHIAADMWSLAVLTEELGTLYAGDDDLLPPAADYRELATRQRALLDSPRGAELLSYWQDRLGGNPVAAELPGDRPRPPAPTHAGDTIGVRLDADVTAALRRLATEHGTTLFVVLLAAFQTLVHRYSGQSDFVVGVPSSGRTHRDLHAVVGYFVNPLLIRSTMDGRGSFADQVRDTKQTVVEALAHQEMPFPTLVERLGLQRDGSRPPGYQLMFSLTTPHLLRDEGLGALQTGRAGARMRLGDLDLESVDLVRRTAEVDLTMVLSEVDDELDGLVNFATDLFDRTTIERLIAHFTVLTTALATTPDTTLGAAPLATAAELAAIDRWNATGADYPRDRTVVDLFAEHVVATPDAPALTYGDTTLTYRELDRVSTALANDLRARGVHPEETVGLLVDRDAAVVVAMLAVAKAGGAYVPLDPAHPRHRLRQIVAESRPVVLVGDTPADLDVLVIGVREHLARADDDTLDSVPATGVPADGLLYVLFTSGSTGTPKGVAITHRNVLRLVTGTSHFTFAPGERVAQVSNAAFDAATLEVWGALCNGSHLIGYDKRTVLDPAALAKALRDNDIHTMVLATPLFTQLVGHDPATFATVRQLLVGGDSMDPKRAAEVAALNGPLLSNGYGPTESATFATIQPLPEVTADRLPIGSPIANTTVYVLDERLRPAPIGVPGELYIGGDGLGRGYLGRADLTADRFRPDPFAEPGTRMYATGDRARWLPDGTIDFLGRTDHQVKIRGFRIELGDVDAALHAHPYVLEAVTVVDTSTGDKRLVGYYAGSVDPAALATHLAVRLPEYMVPAVLVPLDALPKNPNGKFDRDRLPAPSAPVEALVATGRVGEISADLAELLGQPAVDPDDNFFDIGGHSLLAIRLLTRIRERYGVDMPLGDLFDNPTAGAIAEYVDTNAAPGTAAPAGPVALPRRAAR